MNRNNFTIKCAEIEDIPILLEFINKLADYERLSNEVEATAEKLQNSLFGKDVHAFALLGYCDDKPVAFALYFINYSTFLGKPGLYLEDLFVLPEERGKGFGKKMLVYLADYAYQRGYGRFEWSVLDWNKDAINFYEKLGAVAMDTWTTYRLAGDDLANLAKLNNKKNESK